MRKLLLLIILSFMMGCTSNYQLDKLAGQNDVKLDSNKRVFIMVPEDGYYQDKNYPGSGQTTAQEVAAAFSKEARAVNIANEKMTLDEAMKEAKKVNAGYLVTPLITHWEHRATAWSGMPSRMTIRVSVCDVGTGDQCVRAALRVGVRT